MRIGKFEGEEGDSSSAFEVVSRRAGAGTDPVLKVVDAKGATQAEADDTPGLGKDCRLEWTAPGDGKFAVLVSDLHSRGGDEFGYVLEASLAQPDFTLTCDPDKLNVGPGSRVPLFVLITRRAPGFAEDRSTIDLGPMPTGVTWSPLTLGPTMTQGAIVVSADATAKSAAALLTLKGTAQTDAGALVRTVTPRQEIYLPGGGRGVYAVETLAACRHRSPPISPSTPPRARSPWRPAARPRSTSR